MNAPFAVLASLVLLRSGDSGLQVALRAAKSSGVGHFLSLPASRLRRRDGADPSRAAARLSRRLGVAPQGLYAEQAGAFPYRVKSAQARLSIVYVGMTAHPLPLARHRRPVSWWPVDLLPAIHESERRIIDEALQRVRARSAHSSWPVALMPETFTLSQLQQAYETVLQGRLDKRGFRRRIEELAVLGPVAGAFVGGIQRPAQLYRSRLPPGAAPVAGERFQRAMRDAD